LIESVPHIAEYLEFEPKIMCDCCNGCALRAIQGDIGPLL